LAVKRRKPPIEIFSMSFLDIISCAFGAIILLFVLSRQAEPQVIERIQKDLEGVLAEMERTLFELRGEVTILNRDRNARRIELKGEQAELEGLLRELRAVHGEHRAAAQTFDAKLVIEGKLATARQSLTEEMQRLLGESHRRPETDSNIGGLPVDSEYIIFIIDTSGSMLANAWALMLRKMSETLEVYPKVKGIQVMSDMGNYLFPRQAGHWIPDTPERRREILRELRTWDQFSNSSPVEGITRAITTFYAPDKKISLYVFGDEFSGSSIDAAVKQVDAINKEDAQGNRLVRIHGVGFPVQMTRPRHYQSTGVNFATLMRILSAKNGGTFVLLDTSKTVRP